MLQIRLVTGLLLATLAGFGVVTSCAPNTAVAPGIACTPGAPGAPLVFGGAASGGTVVFQTAPDGSTVAVCVPNPITPTTTQPAPTITVIYPPTTFVSTTSYPPTTFGPTTSYPPTTVGPTTSLPPAPTTSLP